MTMITEIQVYPIAVRRLETGQFRAYLLDDDTTYCDGDSSYNAIRGLIAIMEAEDFYSSTSLTTGGSFDKSSERR